MKYFLLILFSLFPLFASEKWVIADWANVRMEPKSHASLVGQIPAGTFCYTSKEKGSWIKIDSIELSRGDYRTVLGTVSGWVSEKLLVDTMYENYFSMRRQKLSNVDSITMWLKREIAARRIPPKELLKHYTKHKDSLGLKQWNAQYNNKEFKPIYIAIPHYNQMRVVGYLDKNGDFHSLEWNFTFVDSTKENNRYALVIRDDWDYEDTGDGSIKKRAISLIPQLIKKHWYSNSKNWAIALETISYSVSVFPPRVNSVRTVMSNREFYYYDIGEAGRAGLTLGKPSGYLYNQMLATTPMKSIKNIGISMIKSDSLLQKIYPIITDCYNDTYKKDSVKTKWLDRIDKYSVTALPYGYCEVSVEGRLVPPHDVRFFEVIFNAKGECVWPRDSSGWGDVPENKDDPFYGTRFESGWISFESLPGIYYSIIPVASSSLYRFDSHESGASGMVLRILTKNGLKRVTLFGDGWGC